VGTPFPRPRLAIFNICQQLGGAIGTRILLTVMDADAAAETGAGSALVGGLFRRTHLAFIIGAICAPFINAPEHD
jgi:DHA2 family lincomycin resistance protein-like MFS transporter